MMNQMDLVIRVRQCESLIELDNVSDSPMDALPSNSNSTAYSVLADELEHQTQLENVTELGLGCSVLDQLRCDVRMEPAKPLLLLLGKVAYPGMNRQGTQPNVDNTRMPGASCITN